MGLQLCRRSFMDLPSWVEKHQLGSLLEMGIRGGRGILHVEQFRFHNSILCRLARYLLNESDTCRWIDCKTTALC